MKLGDKVNVIPNVCPEEECQRLKIDYKVALALGNKGKNRDQDYEPSPNEKTDTDEGVIEGVLSNLDENGKPRTQYYVRVFLDKAKGSSKGRVRLVNADKLELVKAA